MKNKISRTMVVRRNFFLDKSRTKSFCQLFGFLINNQKESNNYLMSSEY